MRRFFPCLYKNRFLAEVVHAAEMTHKELAQRLYEMEKKYDVQFKVVFDAIRELMSPPEKPKRRIGFHAEP